MNFQIPGDLALSENGDRFVTVNGAARVKQNAKQSCDLALGTWRFDLSAGVPIIERVLILRGSVRAAAGLFADRLRKIPGVASVTIAGAALDANRNASISLEIKTQWGEVATVDYPGSGVE